MLAHNFVEVGVIIVFSILAGSMMADVVEDSAVNTARRSGRYFCRARLAGKWCGSEGLAGRVGHQHGESGARCQTGKCAGKCCCAGALCGSDRGALFVGARYMSQLSHSPARNMMKMLPL